MIIMELEGLHSKYTAKAAKGGKMRRNVINNELTFQALLFQELESQSFGISKGVDACSMKLINVFHVRSFQIRLFIRRFMSLSRSCALRKLVPTEGIVKEIIPIKVKVSLGRAGQTLQLESAEIKKALGNLSEGPVDVVVFIDEALVVVSWDEHVWGQLNRHGALSQQLVSRSACIDLERRRGIYCVGQKGEG